MKTAYILFCKQQPKDDKTILELIMHFCLEHDLTYNIRPDLKNRTIVIDGNEYDISLEEKQEEAEPTYWMIYCSLKNKRYHLETRPSYPLFHPI